MGDALGQLTGPGGPFEIVTVDVGGVELQAYRNRQHHLRELFGNAIGFGGADALVQGDERISYHDLLARVRSAAQGFADLGVGKGDRVAIIAANSSDWIVAFWATLVAGAVSVPLNAWWRTEELEFVLEDSGSRVACVDARRLDLVRDLPGSIPTLEHLVLLEAEAAQQEVVPFRSLTTDVDAPMPDVAVDEDDIASLLYTSGTTGKPKGSIQTHRATIANMMNLMVRTVAAQMEVAADPSQVERPKATPTDQTGWLSIVPLFHVTGLYTMAVPAVSLGGKIVFMPPGRFDPLVAMRLIEDERLSILSGVPTVMQRILDSPDIDDHDLSTVSTVSYGGAPAPKSLQRRLAERFPWLAGGGPTTAYGLTETAGVVTVNSGPGYEAHPDSCGPPVPTVEVRIVDVMGEDVPEGERGEVWVKGPIVSPGYWNRPEANEASFTDGWLHTGDIGRIDDEGFLYLLDRAKDMIIRGGENVYCAEVEDVVSHHANVREVAVVGVAHQDLGEQVKAVVVPRDTGSFDVEELQAYCEEHLAHYKVPEIVEVRTDDLPRNPAGKVLKSALRGGETSFVTGAESDSVL